MKKRFLSLLLAISLSASMMSMQSSEAFAAETSIIEISSAADNSVEISSNTDSSASGVSVTEAEEDSAVGASS